MIGHKIGNVLQIKLTVYRTTEGLKVIENFDNTTNVQVDMYLIYNKNHKLNIDYVVNQNDISLTYNSIGTDTQGVYKITISYLINGENYGYDYEPIELVKDTKYYPYLDDNENVNTEILLDGILNFNGLKGDAGNNGYTPQKGIDYHDGIDGKDGYTPIKGIDYNDGEKGEKGDNGLNSYTPVKGIDYNDGVDGYTPVKGIDYNDGVDGYTPVKGIDYHDGVDGYTPIKGIDYFDYSGTGTGDVTKIYVDEKDTILSNSINDLTQHVDNDFIKKNLNWWDVPQDGNIYITGSVNATDAFTHNILIESNSTDYVDFTNMMSDLTIGSVLEQDNQSTFSTKINSNGDLNVWNYSTHDDSDYNINNIYTLTKHGDLTAKSFIGDGSQLTINVNEQPRNVSDVVGSMYTDLSPIQSNSHTQNTDNQLTSNEHVVNLDSEGILNVENILALGNVTVNGDLTVNGTISGDGSGLTGIVNMNDIQQVNQLIQNETTQREYANVLTDQRIDTGLNTINERIDNLPIPSNGTNGVDGYTPIKGVDYFDGTNGTNGVDGYTPIKGVDYFDGLQGLKGDKGDTGYTPIKGIDFFDGEKGDKGDKGNDGYTPIKGTDYFDGINGTNGTNGYTPIKNIDYFDGLQGLKGDKGDTGAAGTVPSISTNRVPKFNGTTYTDSIIRDNGNVGINCTPLGNYMLDVAVDGNDVRFYGNGAGGVGFVLESQYTGGKGWYFNTLVSDGSFGVSYAGTTGSIALPGTKYFYILPDGTATFNNTVTSTGFKKVGGTSTQYLMADGSTSTINTGTNYNKNIIEWRQTNALTGFWIGTVGATTGTYLLVLPSTTTNSTLIKRSTYANVATTTNQVLGVKNNELLFCRQAGYKFFSKCGFNTWTNGGRFFAGFSTSSSSVSANPSALNDIVGFGVDSTDNGLIYFITKGTGTVNKISTGLTITSGKMYDVYFYCDPNGSTISYSITDINTSVTVTGSTSTSLPTATVFTNLNVLGSNASLTTVTATQLSVNKIYVESTY